ncbi:MAG: methyl-accepting chemotaxis protein [Aquabacterium sp.]|nr:methyl-accepting chemotaxis protein [Aquabacterium sp.]
MRFVEGMSIVARLGSVLGLLLLMMVLTSGLGLHKMGVIKAQMDELVNHHNQELALTQKMSESVHIVSRVIRTLVMLNDPAGRASEYKKIETARADYDLAAREAEKLNLSDASRAKRVALQAAQDKARPLNDQVITLANADRDAQATELMMQQAGPASAAWQAEMDALINAIQEETKQALRVAAATYDNAVAVVLGLGALAVAMGLGLTVWLLRDLRSVLGGEPADARRVATAIADGDLTVDVPVRPGDTRSVMAAMGNMRARLADLVSEVRRSSDSIATGSAQIATGNADLSQRTEEQASNLQQTASSMEQLTGTVRSNADTASQANQLATGASAAAVRGGEVVGQVVATMQDIAAASRKISDIIGVIDGIAFQTNILALNAAVEAARAGEQGRGFAVVASEVRSLAQRSAQAAKEIKTLIGSSGEKVELGARQVHDAGSSMAEIVRQVQRVSQLIGEISHATAEQTSGISLVGDAVGQLDQVTQQNAALVEESAAAAESLRHQAARLVEVVGGFRV